MKEILHQWLHILLFVLIVFRTESAFVDITYIQSATARGAVCLDGSVPAYHFEPGSGAGINNWLVDIEGGGWCNNDKSCSYRKNSSLGSSNYMNKQSYFGGILSNQPQFNPDFYNWNRIKVRYCDGSSFTGDVDAVDPSTKLYFRGARIFNAVMEELLAKGMNSAQNAILTGCSAGGLTSILRCDSFRALLPTTATVKCVADGGFFINAKDISGGQTIQDFYNGVVKIHGSANNLPQSCTSQMNPSLCFFPENAAKYVQTPLFFINSDIDTWQIENVLVPGGVDPSGSWKSCKADLDKCSSKQLQTVIEFGKEFVDIFDGLGASSSRGYFINSCYTHCQAESQETWFNTSSPQLGNKRIAEAVGDWFYDRSSFQQIDCPYPCDNTCNNTVFST